ncbi:ubiquitin-like domain-containing protein [Halobacillus shinanisalinarum]|uniref:Ubiquitin-like domain-containing protein n=1 Tax=Halobacillus shinanisalinarum TaxID=2932258 RepID=A0ABY4GT79_9BACI|nr:G5 and 3D domain-containing protein [Halobacillus shinanisalinarum]UOQ91345.1 ubiquitin-like domain-containing protein [Halobacillus shinanisalinarum]
MKDVKSVLSSALVWTFVISTLCITFLGFVMFEATKASVQVTQDGEHQLIRTHANTVEELLSEMNVTVESYDQLSHELSQPITYGMDIEYTASKSINLTVGNKENRYHTTAATVGEFIKDQDLELKERDYMSHDSGSPIEDGMSLEVAKAIQVKLNDGVEEQNVWTTASTVGEFLEKQNVTLDELDKLNVSKGDKLHGDIPVSITRIEKVTDIVQEELEYTVITQKDDSLPKGQERVVSDGEVGMVTKEYKVTITNGEESDRKLIRETVEKESKDHVVALGTKTEKVETASKVKPKLAPAPAKKVDQETMVRTVAATNTSSDAPSAPSRSDDNGAKTLHMKATAYSANCPGCSGITATGINLKENPEKKVIAVDPSVIPLGSRVWVEGYGHAIAGDTGGAIQGNKIDLFIPSKGEANSFGHRTVQVKILE